MIGGVSYNFESHFASEDVAATLVGILTFVASLDFVSEDVGNVFHATIRVISLIFLRILCLLSNKPLLSREKGMISMGLLWTTCPIKIYSEAEVVETTFRTSVSFVFLFFAG